VKIAIYNEFINNNFAETELSKRICLAAENLGWQAIEVNSSIAVKDFNPDFVLALHFKTPKLTGFPTYGCMWNPIDFIEANEIGFKKGSVKRNILTYDGYLSSSSQVDTWLDNLLYDTNKKYFISPFYTSCHQNNYQTPCLDNSHLVYMGTNWDGSRFQKLFQHLDTKEYMEIYGPHNAWRYLKKSYKGSIPFDGVSVMKTLNKAGIGLCLHKEEHTRAEIPSMRIFEIAASGAIAICEEHPFIRKAFGDSVFYIDSNLSASEKSNQISRYVQWIKTNSQEALEMSASAHKIFTEQYSLETLLLSIVPYHQELIKEKGFVTCGNKQVSDKPVELIVRVGGRPVSFIKRCLDSIIHQSYNDIAVIMVKYQELEGLNELLTQYQDKISIKLIETEYSGFRSTQLAAGIRAVSAEYFGILDDDDLIHPNHIFSLVSLLERFNDVGVAYSGSIRVWEYDNNNLCHENRQKFPYEPAKIQYFEVFSLEKMLRFKNFVSSNSFIARSSLIDSNFKNDPKLKVSEDFFILLNLCRKTKFVFTYEATCEIYWRQSKSDNSSFDSDWIWEESFNKIKSIFKEKSFPSSRYLIKSSKFWRLKVFWIKFKRLALAFSNFIGL